MFLFRNFLLAAMVLGSGLFVCQNTMADVIWDESIDGDLSNFETSPTQITVVVGENDILGIIGGTSDPNFGDGFDVFSFAIGANQTMNSLIVNQYITAGGNTSTGINIFAADGTFLGSRAMTTADIGQDLLALSGAGPLTEGSYYISMREFTAPGQQYSFTANVSTSAIPEHRFSFIVSFALCSLLSIRKRAWS